MNNDKIKYRYNLKFLSKVDLCWITLTFKIIGLSRVAFYPYVKMILSCKTTHMKKYSASRLHFHANQSGSHMKGFAWSRFETKKQGNFVIAY